MYRMRVVLCMEDYPCMQASGNQRMPMSSQTHCSSRLTIAGHGNKMMEAIYGASRYGSSSD